MHLLGWSLFETSNCPPDSTRAIHREIHYNFEMQSRLFSSIRKDVEIIQSMCLLGLVGLDPVEFGLKLLLDDGHRLD